MIIYMKMPSAYSKHSDTLHVIIETPRHSRSKYAYDFNTGFFKLKKILPLGMMFPFHFGFIPGTKAEDGDPLDALVLMEEISFPGCIVESRLIGTIKAEQSSKTTTVRNDRLITVASESKHYAPINSINDLDVELIEQLISFFKNYNAIEGKEFKAVGYADKNESHTIIKKLITDG